MEMLVLKKNETYRDMTDKLDEEVCELIYATICEDKANIAEEALDCIQVCIGILDKLSSEGVEIEEMVYRHRQKLLERGWKYTKTLKIYIDGGQGND